MTDKIFERTEQEIQQGDYYPGSPQVEAKYRALKLAVLSSFKDQSQKIGAQTPNDLLDCMLNKQLIAAVSTDNNVLTSYREYQSLTSRHIFLLEKVVETVISQVASNLWK